MAPRKKVDGKKYYKCPHCSKVLTELASYRIHQQTVHTDERPFACEICPYTCKIKKYLTRHVKKKHGKANGPECPVCGKVFHFDSNLKNHMRVHTGEKPYKCPVCGKAFSSTYCLSMHKLIHTNEKPFQCSFCDYACRDSSTLRKHQERHMGIYKTYPCKMCKKIFKTSTSMKIHLDEVHYGLDTRKYGCDKCQKAFKTKGALNLHIKNVHHKKGEKTACGICGKMVGKHNIVNHLRSHVDIKPFKCSYKLCGKAFKDQSGLKKHTLIHYPSLQHKCDVCDCRFPRITRLRQHKLRHITEGGLNCDYCGVGFISKIFLQVHIRRKHYGNVDRYICDLCDTVNYSKRAMILHLRYGHGFNTDVECRMCGARHNDCHSLIEHYLITHNVKYFVQKKDAERIVIKDEPIEVSAEFDFNYDVQKIEVEELMPEPHNGHSEPTLAYPSGVFNKNTSQNIVEKDKDRHPVRAISESDIGQVIDRPGDEEYHNPEYTDVETTLPYSRRVLEENISTSLAKRDGDSGHCSDAFEQFYVKTMNKRRKREKNQSQPKQIVNKKDLLTMQATIKQMLWESKHRKEIEILEMMRRKYNKRITIANKTADKRESTKIKYFKNKTPIQDNSITELDSDVLDTFGINHEPLLESNEIKKEHDDNSSQENDILCQESDNDRYCQVSEICQANNDHLRNSVQCQDNDQLCQESDNNCQENGKFGQESDISQETAALSTNIDQLCQESDNTCQENDTLCQETNNMDLDEEYESIYDIPIALRRTKQKTKQKNANPRRNCQENDKSCQGSGNVCQENGNLHQKDDESIYDMPIALRRNRRNQRWPIRRKKSQENNEILNKNGKLTFNGHECYICFKIFETKNDLKIHCTEHFDLCNDNMLKKCPFCGYVTNKSIKKHVLDEHNINLKYPYGHITEKKGENGPKYVFEIDKDCELEIIPSISNLNKIACMKIDEKNRQNKNMFMGKRKLVKKGGAWVIENKPVSVSAEYLLPEFTKDEYRKLKIGGDSYLDRMKQLSFLAKLKGVKMLFPCSGCDKICQTMAALKLHNRKHETNPKQFRPKVWINRHIEYTSKNRKKIRRNKNEIPKTIVKNPIRRVPVTLIEGANINLDSRRKKSGFIAENRFAAPKPVKNKHKCDKQLIEFYNSNIKGGDIEFWQFLKIFNKMSRENVNDFEDLENREDVHFGLHIKEKPAETECLAETNLFAETDFVTGNNSITENGSSVIDSVMPKIINNKKNVRKNFTRAIMISRKEYKRRNELKNEMRRRLEEKKAQ